MASVFWDVKRIFLIDYLVKGETITGEYYTYPSDRLKTVIAENCLGIAKENVSLHHVNAPVYSSRVLKFSRI